MADATGPLTENAVGAIAVRCVGINAWKDDGNVAVPTKAGKKSPRRPRAERKSARATKKNSHEK
jgi:hypothetical protein